MSIASRIEAIEQHLTNDYSVLEVAGADLTNVDKNIINLKPTWQERLLYFINNGTDVVWNNWEKVTGEGETLTLNSTEEAPMKINLKGNTSQASYGGKNLIPTQTDLWEQGAITGNTGEDSRSTARLRTKEYYPISNDTDYYVSIQNSNYCFLNIILYDSNKGYIGQYYNISSDINGTRRKLINVPSALMPNVVYYRATVRNTNNTATITASEIEIAKPQIELGSTATNWEQYVGGVPSPNPDYPQNIHVVSGDNEIQVCGKNLLPTNASYWESGHYDISGEKTWFDTRMRTKDLVPVSPSTTYYVSNALNKQLIIREYNANKEFIYNTGPIDSGNTFTTQSNTYYLGISIEITYSEYDETTSQLFMCNNNAVDKTHEPYQSASYPISLGVENLWDDNDFQNGYLPTTGSYPTTNPSYPNSRYILIRLNQGQSITIKKLITTNSFRIRYIDVATNQIVGTVVSGTNTYYTSTASYDSALNDGTITANRELLLALWDFTGTLSGALDVTYGTTLQYISNNPIELCKIGYYQDSIVKDNGKWYLNKQIGKVVFDGSENWAINTSYTYNVFYRTLDNYARISNAQTTYCEYYKGIENTAGIVDFGNNYNNSIGVRTANDNIKDIYISNNSITSASDFKTWLSTHNTTVYYVLATPTYTEITDSTLISQLEALNGAKSYTNQTNISQENNDLPFILDVTALKQLTQ